ncbi:MAG: FoF1-type synthase, rane subunit b or b [Sphaerisporangium sp.]|nr:FoF1-type synthase, rane subunit b or b [Sphaerisporangium sp.]
MTNQHDSFPDMMHEDLGFEVVMRGYSRRQVHDHMVRTRNQIRDLEERLARAIDQAEQGRVELSEARRRLAEAPQDYDELGQRLSQILKLAEEEAISKRETADIDAAKTREDAAAECERILAAAQGEAERLVREATADAERLLAQAGSDAEETLGAARAESDDTLRNARAEADRALTAAQNEAERLMAEANAHAEATLESARTESEATLKVARAEATDALTAAQERAVSLDEHTGRRVTFLTDTHTEVMRRLSEMGSVLTDLLHREGTAGALIDESAVLPIRPEVGSVDDLRQGEGPAAEELESVRVVLDDADDDEYGSADDVHLADGVRAGNDVHQPHDDADEDPYAPHVLHDAHELQGPQDTIEVRDRDDHHGNDHEVPAKGRIRGFFEDSEVHVTQAPDPAAGDGLPAHRQ